MFDQTFNFVKFDRSFDCIMIHRTNALGSIQRSICWFLIISKFGVKTYFGLFKK
jgi:hypothetical protein